LKKHQTITITQIVKKSIQNEKKRERVFNLPLARNGSATMAGNGEEGAVETRQSSGRRGVCKVVALWWFIV